LLQQKYELTDYEADILIPTVLDKSGQTKERFKKSVRDILLLITTDNLYPHAKYITALLDTATMTKNNKSKVVCLEEVSALLYIYTTYSTDTTIADVTASVDVLIGVIMPFVEL
jgi:hypothetical protein